MVDFEAELEGRVIKTKVKEKQEAREEYKEAVSNRHTAVLLEETKQDIFEIKVSALCTQCVHKINHFHLSFIAFYLSR